MEYLLLGSSDDVASARCIINICNHTEICEIRGCNHCSGFCSGQACGPQMTPWQGTL